MKKIFFIIIFSGIIATYSCCSQRTIGKPETYRSLPVGHESLLSEANKYNTLRYTNEDFNSYYRGLSHELPFIRNIEYIKTKDDNNHCYCEDKSIFEGHFDYRLPDIHGFQVYYLTIKNCKTIYSWGMDETCGNLIFIDTVSGNAKLINVFMIKSGDLHIDYKYFTIDKDYNITIFSAAYYEEGFMITKRYLIKITPDQKIDVFVKNCFGQHNAYDRFSSNEIPDVWVKQDSCSYYSELYYDLSEKKFPHANYLASPEVKLITEDSIAYWSKYVKTAAQRALNDSIKYINKIERLQNTVSPVDSTLPFGPKLLEYLVKNNKNTIKLKFAVGERNLTDETELKNRKLIYDAWIYYLAFHKQEYSLTEDRIHLKLKTRSYIHLDGTAEMEQDLDCFNEDLDIGYISARISDIHGFEVYYSTIGVYDVFHDACGIQNKPEKYCLFDRYYNCDSNGYLIFYDRNKQHGTLIPVFEIHSRRYQYTFFYISKDNTIHVFEGNHTVSHDDNRSWESSEIDFSLSKSHEIKITKKKEFTVKKIIRND